MFAPAALLVFLTWRPAVSGPTICPFALATDHACPLCGGTRAAAALVRGDLALAWDMHPIIFLVMPLLAAAWLGWIGVNRGWWNPIAPRTMNRLLVVVGVLMVAVWAARWATGTLPPI
jgi:hypothetical protein